MHHRRLAWIMLFGIMLLYSLHRSQAAGSDLDEAFFAVFGQRAPLARSVDIPLADVPSSAPPEHGHFVLHVYPKQLVPLGRRRYALISYENDPTGAHWASGWIAISYLEKVGAHWKLERNWPELTASGVSGRTANAGLELHRYGPDPLVFARSEWCGMGECSDWLNVIRLSQSYPISYEEVLAGAASPSPGTPLIDYPDDTCRSYAVQARIQPPGIKGALFSVGYDGWTAPPNTVSPKTPLHLLTDYLPEGKTLVMRPTVPVPTCGR